MTPVRRLTVVLACLAIVSCDGGVSVSARVVDAAGEPVRDAQAILSRHDSQRQFQGTSDKDGCLTLGGVIAPVHQECRIEIVAQGFKPMRATVMSAERNTALVTMQPIESAAASTYKSVSGNAGCAP